MHSCVLCVTTFVIYNIFIQVLIHTNLTPFCYIILTRPFSSCLFFYLLHLWTQQRPQLWTTCSDTCGLMRKCYGGNFRRRLLYFSHCLPLCMGNGSPPPWDPVGTGNFWPVLAACPLPQARLRQQHFRECLSTGGESEKETNSRGPRKPRQTWESFEEKACMRQPWICHLRASLSLTRCTI